MMEYKGYVAGPIVFDEDQKLFHGEAAGLRDVVTFQARTADDLVAAFHESIDDYLEFCAADGVDPEKPYSGNVVVRMPPELHRKAALRAASEGISLNQWITRRIEAA
jgi:predicted HicB family RNase H-like nuclease